MRKHILLILEPGFFDGEEGPYYCPYAAAMEGMLKYNPTLEDLVDVRRIAYPRPRKDVVALVGEENQGTPVLVLAEGSAVPEAFSVFEETGRAFCHDTFEIATYLTNEFGLMPPH